MPALVEEIDGLQGRKITPYGNGDSKTEQVRDMFDAIAPAYDFMNRAMTFGIDRIWRRIAVGMIRKYRPSSVLDVATGTGDLAFLLCRMLKPARVVGIDLSANMLAEASAKAAKRDFPALSAFLLPTVWHCLSPMASLTRQPWPTACAISSIWSKVMPKCGACCGRAACFA